MRSFKCFILCAGVVSLAFQTEAQGTFQNLGFESALLVPVPGDPYGSVQFVSAFPGWTGYIATVQQTNALYNFTFLDTSAISVIDTNPIGWQVGVFQGAYTAILQAGLAYAQPAADTILQQTGSVPPGAQSLQFWAFLDLPGGVNSFIVEVGGQSLSLVPLQTAGNYTLYGADIHSFAGQPVDLRFTVLAQNPHQANNTVFLDAIFFSDQVIPEPRTVGLFGLGALLLGWRFRRRLKL